MNLHVNFHSLFVKFCAACLTLAIALPVGSYGMNGQAWAASLAPATTYTVNTTLDTPDVDPSNGVCADANGRCSLRAAIMDANFTAALDTILLPAGVYLLTRPGIDDNALVGDLDITHDLTIQGAGSAAAIVDGNGAVTGDRVFQILNTALNVTLSGMTIRNGLASTSTTTGGGILMEGAGHLQLSDVVLDSNRALNGGGLYASLPTQGGSIDMQHVVLHANKALASGVGAGGGMFASLLSSTSTITVQDSQVYSNTADGTGGGFFVDGTDLAQWSIERSQIYSNTAAAGGAIGNSLPLTLSDSSLHNNRVSFDGGAIETFSPMNITRTTMDANTAHRFGGGILDLSTGGNFTQGFITIQQSTISNNSAKSGGGIYHDGNLNANNLLVLDNSTVSGNSVFLPTGLTGRTDGGGLYIYGGQTKLFYTTVANNRINERFPFPQPGIGAGLFITATAVFTAEASLIGDNLRGNGITPFVEDDCFSTGTTGELSLNLIENASTCFVTGGQFGNIEGVDPVLGPLQFNGGPTQTQPLLPGSPAIDVIPTFSSFCPAGVLTDQRGGLRAGGPHRGGPACDLGAYEFDAFFNVFMPFLRRGAG